MDEWVDGRESGAAAGEGWGWRGLDGGERALGTRRHGSACFERTNPCYNAMQDKGVKQYQLKHHVRWTFRYVHPCNLLRPNALLCICESGGGHYTNHRGDTLGASPKTQERETGMKNFEILCRQQYTNTCQCMMEEFLVYIALSGKSKYEIVQ